MSVAFLDETAWWVAWVFAKRGRAGLHSVIVALRRDGRFVARNRTQVVRAIQRLEREGLIRHDREAREYVVVDEAMTEWVRDAGRLVRTVEDRWTLTASFGAEGQ